MRIVSCVRMSLLLGVVVGLLLGPHAAKGAFIFGEPILVPNLNTTSNDSAPFITADGLELYFTSNRDHGADLCYSDIWVATRATVGEPWGTPKNLGEPVNTPYSECNPCVSADGLELYFDDGWAPLTPGCARPDGYGRGDIWVSTRESKEAPWGIPVNLGPMINGFEYDGTPHLSADGLSLYFCTARSAGHGFDLFISTRVTKEDLWGQAVDLGAPINTMYAQDYLSYPFVSPDGLSLFFSGSPLAATANGDTFMSMRASVTDPWGPPVYFTALSTARNEEGVTFSVGDTNLYFGRSDSYNPNAMPDPALGSFDLWQVEVTPIVDLNDDGIVDAVDICLMIDFWHTNDPLCDIAPAPLGDGFVDVQDLVVLAEHLGPGLECVAHWKLDETKGVTAYDSVGDSDATVMGDATWRPAEGKVGGALRLDGVDDYLSTEFVADPGDELLRVVCWIRSDVAGRAIVSQTKGSSFASTWLATDPSDGTLMTGMMFPFPVLHSAVVASDGQWHEVAVEWNGTYRRLWLDKQEVARDAQPMSTGPLRWNGTLNIGTGQTLSPDSFFVGLIDDVRIYTTAVAP